MANAVYLLLLTIIAALGCISQLSSDLGFIQLPEGFHIGTYADFGGSLALPGPNAGPRFMLLRNGTLYVSLMGQGKVVALPDADKNGKADNAIIFMEGLKNPHGLEYHEGWFYIAEEHRVIRARDDNNDMKADSMGEVVISNLPTGGHFTRTIKIYNNSLYLSIGSSCNVCREEDERRAAISRCGVDGTNCSVYASGLRNSVGFVFHEGKMYATDNGRDLLGNDIPPEEVNAVEEGKDYGWPICYGNRIHDTEFDKNTYVRDPCADTTPPLVQMQAHSAPLGLAFYEGTEFPEEYRGDLFVAFHGSWNRDPATGYKVVRIDMETLQVSDFVAGWLNGTQVLGRPVGIITADGALFVSDDNAGKIYRIWYE